MIAPAGRFAFVPNGFEVDGSPYNVSAYTIDSTRGTLTPVQGSPFVDPGSLPYGGAVDSTSSFAYITNASLQQCFRLYHCCQRRAAESEGVAV